MTPTYSVKKGTRYRYYVSTALLTGGGGNGQSAKLRVPAGDLEALVIGRIRAFLADPAALLQTIETPSQGQAIEFARRLAEQLTSASPDKVKSILSMLKTRANVRLDGIEIKLSRRSLALCCDSTQPGNERESGNGESEDDVILFAAARLKRAGREMRMVVEGSDSASAADPSLLKMFARAHEIQAHLLRNPQLSIHDIAREAHLTPAYIFALLRIPWLAPDITTAIINGRHPMHLNATKLMRLTARLPAVWDEQRALLGLV
jgi:hypothetical protein